MSTVLKIPMNEETRISLEDCFIDDDNMDARKFIFDLVKMCCQDGKRCLRANETPVNKKQDNWKTLPPQEQYKQEPYSLKGVELDKYTLDMNPEWLPKGLDKEDSHPIELKLGDNTMKYLKAYGQMNILRHERFNTREVEMDAKEIEELTAAKTDEKQIESTKKNQEAMKKTNLDAVPNSMEECVYTGIWMQVEQKIAQGDNTLFDKEYDEIYKKADEPQQPPVEK